MTPASCHPCCSQEGKLTWGSQGAECSRQRSGVVKAWQLGSWAWTWGKGDRAEVKRVESRPTAQSADPRGGEVRAWGEGAGWGDSAV